MIGKIKAETTVTEQIDAEIESWRRRQPVIPNRREALRSLIEAGLAAESEVRQVA